MRRLALLLASIWCLLSLGKLSSQDIPKREGENQRTPILDPNQTDFPDSCLADFSATLDHPAGKHGFLSVDADAHLRYEDGTRARFFGINIAKTSVFQPKERINRVIEVLARAGINLVRFHHLDDVDGLFDRSRGDTRHLASAKLESLDYWISELKKRGIYTYLDLLDYRTFMPGDKVADADALRRGARPYAVFNRRLLELQKEYARQLLVEHVNRYTGLAYARDPAVAMVELMDENGLMIRGHEWRTLVPRYRQELQSQWNVWLGQTYGATARLRAAWTNYRGQCALGPGEELERGTVELPDMALPSQLQKDYRYRLTAAARRNDGARFAYSVHRAYFREMKDYLRMIGVRVPLGAVVSTEVIADLCSVAEELDFIGNNYFFDHPHFLPATPWKFPSSFRDHHPTEAGPNSFAPAVSLAKMYQKPLVVREWSYCYPNRHRAVGMIEAAAYARRLDLDALFLFAYDLHQPNGGITYFDVHADPTRWGMAALAARIFLGDAVSPAPRKAVIGYSPVDSFSYRRHQSELYQLAWLARIENHCYQDRPEVETDLLISSGHSGSGAFPGQHCLLFTHDQHLDLGLRQVGEDLITSSGYALKRGAGASSAQFAFEGLLYNQGQLKQRLATSAYLLQHGQALGLTPIGVSRNQGLAYGFYDPKRSNLIFGTLSYPEAFRAGLDALHLRGESEISHGNDDQGVFGSEQAPLQRDLKHHLIKLHTPTAQAILGKLNQPTLTVAGQLRLRTDTPVGALVAVSLDGQPLSKAQSYLIKLCTVAYNSAEQLVAATGKQKTGSLRSLGQRPIRTGGKVSSRPTEVWVNQRKLLEVYVVNGTWELLVEGGRCQLFCDTPGARFVLPSIKGKQLTMITQTGDTRRLPSGTEFRYPQGGRLVSVNP